MDRPPRLDIDLNEEPSPAEAAPSPPREVAPPVSVVHPALFPPLTPPPLGPAPPVDNPGLVLSYEARELALRIHQAEALKAAAARAIASVSAGAPFGPPPPAEYPGEAGWGNPLLPCASCGRPEELGGTIVCDACERGFHISCVRVWPPLMPQPPPSPPDARRPRAAANEDWMCPECEMRGARTNRWKLGPVQFDINAVPPEDPLIVTASDVTRTNAADGTHLTKFSVLQPHFEGLHLQNTTLYDENQFMPAFDFAHCLSMRQQFTSMDQDIMADGNIAQRSIHLRRKGRGLPQTSSLPRFAENQELGSANIFMDPSFFTKATELSSTENRSSLKPPKFLVENAHQRIVGLPVQYRDFFITSLGEIDKRASYHNCYQIWPVGFMSYWHDRVTGSLFECEVCDGGNFGPLFKVRRLSCSVFPLLDASTILCQNGARKAETIETKESNSLLEDTANDTDDNILMLLSDHSGTNQDLLSCFSNDMGTKRTSLSCSDVQSSSRSIPTVLPHSGTDKIGEFTFEGTSPSSVWRMISCALLEACEKMYKEHGRLVFFCTHDSAKHSFDNGSGCQNFGPYTPLNRFCSSYGPNISRVIEKESDVEHTYSVLKEWLYQDRIGFDLEFVQEIVESLPRSGACSNYQFLCNRAEFVSSLTVASGALRVVHKNGQSNGDFMSYGRHGSVVTELQDHTQPSGSNIRELPPGRSVSRKLPPELAGEILQIWEFLGRFSEIIGLKEIPSYEQLEDELMDPWPVCANQKEKLSNDIQHCRDHTSPMNSPANVSTSCSNGESGLTTNEEVVSVFIPVETFSMKEAAQDKLAAQTIGRYPNIDPKESKTRRGRKRDTENLISAKEFKFDMLTANKLTWPELARRYILAVSSISGCMDLSDISSREGVKLFRCLQGDGGILCGALPGVAGMEKDALLLVEAENLICNSSLNEKHKVFMMDYKDTDMVDSPEVLCTDSQTLPDWAKSLEPVRKLPTNVGTRIRKCVYEALERKPPEWARKILEHSISKEVYKGNASGPTKQQPFNNNNLHHDLEAEADQDELLDFPHLAAEEPPEVGDLAGAEPQNSAAVSGVSSASSQARFVELPVQPPEPLLIQEEQQSPPPQDGTATQAIVANQPPLPLVPPANQAIDANQPPLPLAPPAQWTRADRPIKFVYARRRFALPYVGNLACLLWELLLGRKAVLSVLTEACCVKVPQNPEKPRKERNTISILEAILKKCRVALRSAISSDESKIFGNLLGTTLMNSNENEDEGILGFPGMVSRPLDFRTIDIRLAMGAYCGSWEAFLEDVQEVIHNLHTAFGDRPDVVEMVVALSQNFESLYKTEVLGLVQKFDNYLSEKNAGSEMHEELYAILTAANSLPKAPWEDGVCKRIYLLKFLCDEMLNTALIREHLDQCLDKLGDLQQKFRALNFELKDLKYKEERTSYVRQSRWSKTERHFSNSSGLVENQQHCTPMALDHLEEAEQGNVGVNLNDPAEGGPDEQLNVGRHYKSDKDMSSTSMIEEHMSLGLSEQPAGMGTDHIYGDAINEGSQSCEKTSLGVKSSTCDNLNLRDTQFFETAHVATVISTPRRELPDENASTSFQDNLETATTKSVELDTDNNEMDTLSDDISRLQVSISSLESQINMASLRRECLGKDSLGRLYWVIGRPGKRPWLVADGSMLIAKETDISMVNSYPASTYDCRGWNSASIFIYESDEEIQCLVDWLRDYDPREKELKDSILQWQRHLCHQSSAPLSDPPMSNLPKSEQLMDLPNTKAAVILEQKYGLQLDEDTSDLLKKRGRKLKSGSEERTYRCDCLEPVWPSRHHCLTCHETCLTSTEFEGHNDGKCNKTHHSPDESKENDERKVKVAKSDIKEKDSLDRSSVIEPSCDRKLMQCPYDFEEICRKFITNDSNKDTVKQIGLNGSNGVPSFVPSPAFFLEPAVVQSQNKKDSELLNDWTSSLEECNAMSAQKIGQQVSKSGQNSPGNTGDEKVPRSRKPGPDNTSGEGASSTTVKPTRLLAVNGGLVLESSLRPVIGRKSHILKQQKINLLDIDAALPEEALRASKSQK
ncbi:hypothetical protein GUJ93_ZPchr0002g26350 [Zizania palustris]|uniref:PHD-type domain-containing protein n=1 Tax=Zizania palustris TaxID=103762 RepID=A0A8J5S576_ZIZPA|nr:hypothetical protein GUJ93_ZPchr0002g26350 [Zizania palustris]KAG8058344.1 hypothetical protein GUJ93_ZPchr0002g26350 [Zizania palustris]